MASVTRRRCRNWNSSDPIREQHGLWSNSVAFCFLFLKSRTQGEDSDSPFLSLGYLISFLTLVLCITDTSYFLCPIFWFRQFHFLPDAICIVSKSLAQESLGEGNPRNLFPQLWKGHSPRLLQDLMLRNHWVTAHTLYILSFFYCTFDTTWYSLATFWSQSLNPRLIKRNSIAHHQTFIDCDWCSINRHRLYWFPSCRRVSYACQTYYTVGCFVSHYNIIAVLYLLFSFVCCRGRRDHLTSWKTFLFISQRLQLSHRGFDFHTRIE
jgi:hypothetical protein